MFEMFGEKCTSDGFTDVSSQKNGEKWLAYFMVWNPHEYAVKVLSISNFFRFMFTVNGWKMCENI